MTRAPRSPSAGPGPGSRLALPGPSRQVAADLVVIAVFALALLTSRDFAPVAVWFPTAVGIAGMVAGAGKLAVDLRALRQERAAAGRPAPPESGPEPEAGEPDPRQPADLVPPPLTATGRRELLIWLGLLAVLLLLIRVIGMVPAAAVWLPAVLWWRGRRSLWLTAGGGVGVVVLLVMLETQLSVRWPEPVLDIYGMLT